MEEAVAAEGTTESEPTNVHIEFTGPTEDELNQWLASISQAAEAIGSQAEQIANSYAE